MGLNAARAVQAWKATQRFLRRRSARTWTIVFAVTIAVAVAIFWATNRRSQMTRLEAPRPTITPDSAQTFSLESSILTVPIRIELGALLDEVEQEVPTQWGDIDEWHELSDRAEVAVALERSPFTASFVGATARLASTVSYRARGRYSLPVLPDPSVSCGTEEDEPRPRLDVSLEGELTITPDWSLAAETSVAELAATSDSDRDRCEITFLGIDVTDRVMGLARTFLEENSTVVDSLIGEAGVRDNFEEWWDVLRTPIELDDEIWLDMRPISIRRGEPFGEGQVLEIPATLTARPRIVLGERPPMSEQELPQLGTGTNEGALRILIEGVAEYASASERLTEALGGEVWRGSGRELRIQSLEVIGIGGGRVALEVNLAGDVEGRIFLVGTPEYDPQTGFVSVPDLRLDVSTSNLIVASASWIGDLGLELMLRDRARWRVAPAIDFAADKLREGLNRELTEGVNLEGTVDDSSIRILGVSAYHDSLIVWAEAEAEARLLIDESV